MSSEETADLGTMLSYRQVETKDLELLLAWRSNPKVYEHFRGQEGPLNWEDHLSWFGSRPAERQDYVIEYRGRRVGSVFITLNSYVGVYVGEVDLWGEGIGSAAVKWLCEKHDRETFFAEIHANNHGSKRLFEDCGFVQHGQQGDWLVYRRDS